jgi:hypothetical protein
MTSKENIDSSRNSEDDINKDMHLEESITAFAG